MLLYPEGKSLLELTQLVATSAVFCVAIWAIFVNRRSQREQTARNAYLKYLDLAIQNPSLTSPHWGNGDLESECLGPSTDDERKRKENFEKYEWFLSFLLNTASLVWETVPKSHAVARLMTLQIAYHWMYFDHFKERRRFLVLWYEIHKCEMDRGIKKGRNYEEEKKKYNKVVDVQAFVP